MLRIAFVQGHAAQPFFNDARAFQETKPCKGVVLPYNLAFQTTQALNCQHHAQAYRQGRRDANPRATSRNIDRLAFPNATILV